MKAQVERLPIPERVRFRPLDLGLGVVLRYDGTEGVAYYTVVGVILEGSLRTRRSGAVKNAGDYIVLEGVGGHELTRHAHYVASSALWTIVG